MAGTRLVVACHVQTGPDVLAPVWRRGLVSGRRTLLPSPLRADGGTNETCVWPSMGRVCGIRHGKRNCSRHSRFSRGTHGVHVSRQGPLRVTETGEVHEPKAYGGHGCRCVCTYDCSNGTEKMKKTYLVHSTTPCLCTHSPAHTSTPTHPDAIYF